MAFSSTLLPPALAQDGAPPPPPLPSTRVLPCSPPLLACSSWTNKLITAKDHASVQINVGHLDESGVYTGSFSTFALCGQLRIKVCVPAPAHLPARLPFAGRCREVPSLLLLPRVAQLPVAVLPPLC